MNIISATEARNRFFELINLVMYQGKEFIVEKNGQPAVKVTPVKKDKSAAEIKKILAEVRAVFAKSAERKQWSVIDSPVWKRKEKQYLNKLSKGIID